MLFRYLNIYQEPIKLLKISPNVSNPSNFQTIRKLQTYILKVVYGCEVTSRGKHFCLCPQKPGGIVLKKLHPREEFLQHEVKLPRILFKTLHAPNELKTFLKFWLWKESKITQNLLYNECAVIVCSFKTL